MVAVRYNPDGSLDPTFGHAGKVATSERSTSPVGRSRVLHDGEIVVSGQTHNGDALFARFTANGRIDKTFGKQGYAKVKRPAASHVLASRDGKIMFVTDDSTDGLGISTVYRLLPDGRLDTGFGTGKPWSYPVRFQPWRCSPIERSCSAAGTATCGRSRGSSAATTVSFPSSKAKTVAKAKAKLKKSRCSLGSIIKVVSSKVARGHVVSTFPLAGAHEPGGAPILLNVGRGRR